MKYLVKMIFFSLIFLPFYSLFSQDAVVGDKKYTWYLERYPFLEGRNKLYSLETEFRWPEGYKRIDPASLNAFQEWISNLPLWRRGKPVSAYGKGIFLKVGEFSRTIQLPWRSTFFTDAFIPLQLLCEFLHSRRQDHRIEIVPKMGEPLSYTRWLSGEVAYDRLGNLTCQPSKKREASELELSRYLNEIAININYTALKANCEPIKETEIAPGDLYIAQSEDTRLGKVYIILTILVNEKKDRLYVLATGCPEACDFHIPLFNDDENYPWITLEQIKDLAGEYSSSGFYRLKSR